MPLFNGGDGEFCFRKVGSEVVPCKVYVCMVVQVPVDTCSYRQLAVTLDARLPVLRCYYEHILAIFGKGGINHNLELVGCSVTANAVE